MKKYSHINWGPVLFLSSYHLVLLIGLPIYIYYATFKLGLWLFAFALLYLTGFSITGGYHRFFAHRTFKAHKGIEAILLFFASLTAQGSALRWAFDHRQHHAFVDTDNDPHSIHKGFWYAHFLWIIENPKEIDPKVVPDLFANKQVMFQHRYYPYLMVASNALFLIAAGFLFQDFWGAFFVATLLRMFCLHHFTWFINSLAHTWGNKPFCQEQTAVNNYIMAFLTFGEGYHNYHHTFPRDYRNGVRWYHFDPTKWVIWILYKAGLAYQLKKIDSMSIKKRLVIERKNLLLKLIKGKVELTDQVNELSERLVKHLAEFTQAKENYLKIRNESANWEVLQKLKEDLKTFKVNLKTDWRHWHAISRSIMNQWDSPKHIAG